MPHNLDQDHINAAAAFAADMLAGTGAARVRLTPGDMTEYHIVITGSSPTWSRKGWSSTSESVVSLVAAWGTAYPWSGQYVDPGYAAEKWTARGSSEGTRACTGDVVARFLNAVRVAMGAEL